MPRQDLKNWLLDLEDSLVLEGYPKGSPLFKLEILKRRVGMCREMQGLGSCEDCRAAISCSLADQLKRDLKYGVEERKNE